MKPRLVVLVCTVAFSGLVHGRLLAAVAPPPALPAASAPAAPAPAPPKAREIEVQASVDRTAVWVGDHVTYTVDVICKPGVDILDDDLSKDHLKLEGLDVLSTEITQQDAADGGRLHRFRYVLTTYHVDAAALKIAPMSVRYFTRRAGQRVQDATPAGDVVVPGVTLAYRSMLPDAQESYGLRDARVTLPRSRLLAHAQGIGWALVIVSMAPALFWIVGLVQNRRRVVRRSKREVREQERASLEAARALDLGTVEGRRDAYGQMNTIVREHLRDACGVPGLALTPAEIEPALGRTKSRVPADQVTALLLECDRARYAPADALPKADVCRDALDRTEQILAVR
ncbi:MAG TPA: hypothetical protein VGJ29_04040 [Vicinamibacterales bacterium]